MDTTKRNGRQNPTINKVFSDYLKIVNQGHKYEQPKGYKIHSFVKKLEVPK